MVKDPELEESLERSRRVREQVPSLEKTRQWYGPVYRFLSFFLKPWPRKFLPHPLLLKLNRARNFVIPFHEVARARAREMDDPSYSLLIPEGESVIQGGLWVAEFFPPSLYQDLERQLKSNGWDKDGRFWRSESNAEMVAQGRIGQGWAWSRIGDVSNPHPNAGRLASLGRPLPDDFRAVELSAVQIGKSVTAIVAFFTFSEAGSKSLDRALRKSREPYLVPNRLGRADVIDRRMAGIRATKAERKRIHDEARGWLEKRCKGYFSGTRDGQPVVDLTLFDKFDPLADDLRSARMNDPLDALGLGAVGTSLYVSPQLPGGTLVPHEGLNRPLFGSVRNCWGFIGSQIEMQVNDDMNGYGPKPWTATTFAHKFDDSLRAFLIKIATRSYLEELQGTYSRARDSARVKHGRFRASRLKSLRAEMLQTSLDLHVVARDLSTLWETWFWQDIQVELTDTPGTLEEYRRPPLDYIKELHKVQKDGFKELLAEDAAYRELMVTVASLGASAEASQLGKRALMVAAVSLVVASVTLLLTDIGSASLFADFVEWWRAFGDSAD